MTGSARLRRDYRRLLTLFPREFRRDSEQEILSVLMDTARPGQRRVGLAESADLLKGALRMRLRRPVRPPRTVVAAVRLMWLGVVLELAVLITLLASVGDVQVAVGHSDPAQWPVVHALLVLRIVCAVLGMALWLWLAWAVSAGRNWGRAAFAAYFLVFTVSLLADRPAAGYAPADVVVLALLWIDAATVLALLLAKPSVA